MHIFEGFFGKHPNGKKQSMLSIEKLKQNIGGRLINGEPISDEDWEFIDNYMDGYVKPTDTKKSLRRIIDDSIEAYGDDVHLNWIDVSEVTNMKELFSWKTYFNGDISRWNTNMVTDMSTMFCDCACFNCDISQWDTSRVTDMNNMFNTCKKFNQDISRWDVSNVLNMNFMFSYCQEFGYDLSRWDVSSVKYMNGMFNHCYCFSCNLSKWDVSKVYEFNFFAILSGLPERYIPKFKNQRQ